MESSLKTGFAQISLPAQNIWAFQNLGGGCKDFLVNPRET